MPRSIAATLLFGASLFGAALAGGPLHAQTSAIPTADEELMVRVDVTNMNEALAAEVGVGVDALPRSVEVNLPVAAEVCDVTVEQLRQVRSVEQHVECKAVSISTDLAEATKKQIEAQ